MIVLGNGDIIEGDATNASEVDFTIHGLDNNVLALLANGQLASSKGTIYTADSVDVITSIILVNTGAAHNHVNLYLKKSGGTSRRLIEKDYQLEINKSITFDGKNVGTGGGATVTDETISMTDVTTNDASTTKHGFALKATAPAAGLTNVIAIENGETVYKNKALYDATVPSTQAIGDTAATGSAVTAARRDHKHAMPASTDLFDDTAGGTDALTTKAPTSNVMFDAFDAADFFLNKQDRLITAHAGDNTRVVVAAGIPLKIGSAHFITTATDVDAVDDLDTGTLAAGTNYYVYACTDGSTLSFKVSAASTYPSGFDAAHSRKIGGFHTLCAAVGTIAGHPLTDFAVKDILPASIWDLKHRPRSQPEGMVWVSSINKWVDIYLTSGTGTSAASANGGTISDTRDWMSFADDYAAVAKRLLSDDEFQASAAGSPEEAQIYTGADPVTTGGHTAYELMTLDVAPGTAWVAGDTITGVTSTKTCVIVTVLTTLTYLVKNRSGAFTLGEILTNGTYTADQGGSYPKFAADSRGRIISNFGLEDSCGVQWQWLRDQSYRFDGATAHTHTENTAASYVQNATTGAGSVDVAPAWAWQDLTGGKGSLYKQGTYGDVKLLAGGTWYFGAACGSRARNANNSRWTTNALFGGRALSDPL